MIIKCDKLGQAQLKLGFDFTLVFWKFIFSESSPKMEKNHPMVPPLNNFQGKKKKLLISCHNNQYIETIIFCKLDHFWAALWTKKIFPSQNRDFENGVIVKIYKY